MCSSLVDAISILSTLYRHAKFKSFSDFFDICATYFMNCFSMPIETTELALSICAFQRGTEL